MLTMLTVQLHMWHAPAMQVLDTPHALSMINILSVNDMYICIYIASRDSESHISVRAYQLFVANIWYMACTTMY